jgi:hypothetical protein
MFCHKCGGQLHADAEFCHKCGRPVPQTTSSSAVSSTLTETGASPKAADSPKTTTPVESSQRGASLFAWLYIIAGVFVFGLGMHAQMQIEPVSLWLVLIVQGLLFLTTGFAILGKKKSAITLVWVTAILGAIGTIARGLVLLDIIAEIATVAFAIWFQTTSQAHSQEKATQSSSASLPKMSAETTLLAPDQPSLNRVPVSSTTPITDHASSSFWEAEREFIVVIVVFVGLIAFAALALR